MQNSNCKYGEAKVTCGEAMKVIEQLETHQSTSFNKATLYAEYCSLLFAESQYDEV